jgi:hypothetical protein
MALRSKSSIFLHVVEEEQRGVIDIWCTSRLRRVRRDQSITRGDLDADQWCVLRASQNKVLMLKFVRSKLHAKHSKTTSVYKYAHQQLQILFFKLIFNVKLIHSIQVLGPWLWGNRPFFFSSVVGQRKGPSGENAPPVHGIKKGLDCNNLDRQ